MDDAAILERVHEAERMEFFTYTDVGRRGGCGRKWGGRGGVQYLFFLSPVVFFGTQDRDNWGESEASLQHHAPVCVKK